MKAAVYHTYGRPDVLEIIDIPKPEPKAGEVLVKMHAVSLNASDWEFLTGSPVYARLWGFFKPKGHILGSDIAGTVEVVGKGVTRFKVGDTVFGDVMYSWGGFAEYAALPEKLLIHKPDTISFAEASAIPQAAVVALQGLRDKGRIKAGESVLINGGGGGAGTFAIQLARMFGAVVTGVDSSEKLEVMKKAGADHVIDYRATDFTKGSVRYDLILDLVAYRSMFDHVRALKKGGRYVIVGGAVPRMLQTLLLAPFVKWFCKKEMGILAHEQKREDLAYMLELHSEGTVKPIVDRHFPYSELVAAFCHQGAGHSKGKTIVTFDEKAGS